MEGADGAAGVTAALFDGAGTAVFVGAGTDASP